MKISISIFDTGYEFIARVEKNGVKADEYLILYCEDKNVSIKNIDFIEMIETKVCDGAYKCVLSQHSVAYKNVQRVFNHFLVTYER